MEVQIKLIGTVGEGKTLLWEKLRETLEQAMSVECTLIEQRVSNVAEAYTVIGKVKS